MRDDSAATTVEWVFLTALAVGISIPVLVTISQGTGSSTAGLMSEMSGQPTEAERTGTERTVPTPATLTPPTTARAAPRPAGPAPVPSQRERFQSRAGELTWGDPQSPYAAGISADVVVATTRRSPDRPRTAPPALTAPLTLDVRACEGIELSEATTETMTEATADGAICARRSYGLPGL
ncbi:hypothetical protein HMH01_15425 [Halovulum dunhuangense]|uniref:Uncharacterized protein n=1 Tax=Halovulum dunhuangense TaxID=1505036 RepID=A0A849L6X8_9RHOB|nr:hypothetical protein [Halovulum dunhuangense]NNU81827.1 hypothetical protein [Halovulum dunhuangense]